MSFTQLGDQPRPLGLVETAHWGTFRQIASMGGSVKKGEHGTLVVYTNWFKVQDEKTGEEKELPFMKQYAHLGSIAQLRVVEALEPVSPPHKAAG